MKTITWKLLLKSNTKSVFQFLSTPEGRTKFWSEKSSEKDTIIHFVFPNGRTYHSRTIKIIPNKEFHLSYFDSLVKFQLESSINGGTELTLINEGVSESDFPEVNAGWVSVLMNLKAVADFRCDLRNHDPNKTWDQGYANN
ncbi:SRPBCC domain-containing protein [Maribacter polysaccharolyticus]|uniref:SRPBCC domain-containing protein n=1 Tax=Maribacter polysaccharolyticus TaxID=3020831 RepID=UPI00237F4145|nr:SRPBCC domain-containing protein [Maribacter polysaccharolyticus]MDE3743418.1 SRPBCC domain-containing protein [Maribacter polysaccharolyticus]